ncbi:DUF2510 domain-containing protein [Streptomyces sp. SID8379]|nr:DUF2510 domain-containing protein [Streptomyces sp. SID8379]
MTKTAVRYPDGGQWTGNTSQVRGPSPG